MNYRKATFFLVLLFLIPSLVSSCASPSMNYEFPESIDSTKKYLFYLHGKIIEDQGIPAISSEYGEYEYRAILERLAEQGFIVISERRSKNTNSNEYAKLIAEQISSLMSAGVSANNITVVGASKGAAIAIIVSHLLENESVNFVFLGTCHPDVIESFKQDQINLHGNILAIYDSEDKYAGTCDELISISDDRGISGSDEIVLDVGTGHGILYKPLDEWILPSVQWANEIP